MVSHHFGTAIEMGAKLEKTMIIAKKLLWY